MRSTCKRWTKTRNNSKLVGPRPTVRSFVVRSSPVLVFFLVHRTRPSNTRFIEGFSHHAQALFDLTKKDVRFAWDLAQQDMFEKLKSLVTSAPVLTLPDEGQPYRVEANGSGIATGAVLSQLSNKDGKWHPVAFLSKLLSEPLTSRAEL